MNSPPSMIAVVFLHPGCNMHCTFCVTDNALSAMRFDQALDLLDLLRVRGFDNLVLGGGEPFTWEHDLVRLSREAKQRGFFVQVGTNGTVLPEGYQNLESIDRYVLPLDAADEATHNRLRRFKEGHHRVVCERLRMLQESRGSVTVSTVVTAQNAHALPGLAAFLRDYQDRGGRLHAWHLYKFIELGRGGAKNADQLRISDEDYHEVCAPIKQMDLGFQVYKRKDMFHSKTVDFFWYQGNELQVGSAVWDPAASVPGEC